MNTLTLVVLGVVAWLFFLSGSSFLFLMSIAVLLLYSLVEVGASSHHHEQAGRSGDPGGSGATMEKTAGTLGDGINAFGTLFGKLFSWAFKGEKTEKKKEEYVTKFKKDKSGNYVSTIEKKD